MNFDQKAKDWDKDPQRVERAALFSKEIISFLGKKKTDNALEFGSGTGLVSFELKDRFKSITLADNSSGMIEVLTEKIRQDRISNMRPILIDIFKNGNELSCFDIIYTLLTLHHIKDIPRTIEIFHLILNTGGYVCIGDLITEDGSFHHRDPEFDGHKGFDPDNIKSLLKLSGFIVEYEKIFNIIEREHNQIMKKYPLFMIIGKKV